MIYIPNDTYTDRIVPELTDSNMIPIESNNKLNSHSTEEEDFYFLGQHLNMPGLLEEYSGYYEMSKFEIANRAFYATIRKFTKQNCSDPRERSPPYSFLVNWHLHNIYSKSQQTLLGISPVKPSVILSGDDFMYTPAFNTTDCDPQEDPNWDNPEESGFHNLIPCPDSNQAGRYTVNNDDHIMMTASLPPFFSLNEPTEIKQKYGDDCYSSFDEYSLRSDINPTWIDNDCRLMNLNGYDSTVATTTSAQATSATSSSPVVRTSNSLLSIVSQEEDDNTHILNLLYEEPCSDSSDEHQTHSYCSTINSSTCSIQSNNDNQQAMDTELSHNDLFTLFDSAYTMNDEINRHQDMAQIMHPITQMTRSTSFLSQKSIRDDLSVSSVLSYQSLADILQNNQNNKPAHSYGSMDIHGESSGMINTYFCTSLSNNQEDTEDCTLWMRIYLFMISLWQFFIFCLNSFLGNVCHMGSTLLSFCHYQQSETQPLLP